MVQLSNEARMYLFEISRFHNETSDHEYYLFQGDGIEELLKLKLIEVHGSIRNGTQQGYHKRQSRGFVKLTRLGRERLKRP